MPILDFTNRTPREELDKLPKPTNDGLRLLFADVDTVNIKDGGMSNGRALRDTILLTITGKENLEQFSALLEIDEPESWFYCMCLGTYAIELVSKSTVIATIGYHHGVSIRYDKWSSDASLTKSDSLITFLTDLGFTKPLNNRIAETRRIEAEKQALKDWLEMAPKCFGKYQPEIDNLSAAHYSALLQDLAAEFPNEQARIFALLKCYGKTDNYWTAYPNYEQLPNNLLRTFEVGYIIDAYLSSDRNDQLRRGLGRFLCSHSFKRGRKKQLKFIPMEIINDLEICFNKIGEQRGIDEIFSLKNEKYKS